MKLARTLTLLGIGLSTFGLVVQQSGCGGGSSGTGGGDGGGKDATGGDAGPSIVPPPAPAMNPTSSTKKYNFALHQLFLGDTDRQGNPDPTGMAWANYGYNLDGLDTTQSSTNVCTLAMSAPKSTQIDGNGGIDNSFGENILPIITTAAGSDTTAKINQSINGGSFTIMFDVTGLSDDPMQTNTGLTGQLFAGGKFPGMPTWTTADNWPVLPELLNNPNDVSQGSKVQFASAYVVNGTFVNGMNVDVTLSLMIQGVSLSLTIHHAIITFDHSAPTKATNGTIAGVINTQELVMGLGAVIGRVTNGSICPTDCTMNPNNTFCSIAGQIEQASDIVINGSQVANMAGTPCNGISIGLGFTADQIAEPSSIEPPNCLAADPCNPDAAPPMCDSGMTPQDSGSPTDSGGGG